MSVRSIGWVDLTEQRPAPPAAGVVVIGADIGQKVDPTALVVAETHRLLPPAGRPWWSFTARHLERLPLGTDYPAVAARIVTICDRITARPRPALTGAPRLYLLVDSTGVGAPVVDILRRELRALRATGGPAVRLTAATFTHGDRLTGGLGAATLSVGKAYLVSRLQALFQTGRVRLPAGHAEAAAMMRELMDYEIKISEDANDKYGAFRVGTHDDLVTALGLAVLCDPPGPAVRSC